MEEKRVVGQGWRGPGEGGGGGGGGGVLRNSCYYSQLKGTHNCDASNVRIESMDWLRFKNRIYLRRVRVYLECYHTSSYSLNSISRRLDPAVAL